MIKIISCHPIFNENALVLSQKFNWQIIQEFNPEPSDLFIVYGAHEMCHQLLKIQEERKFNFGYVILNSEQEESQFMKNKYYLQLMKSNVVFDYSNKNMDFLKSNFNIKTFSYFFFEFINFQTDILQDGGSRRTTNEVIEKEYDIVFVGTKNQEREDIYNNLINKFPNLNILFDFDWSYKSSDELTKLLYKTKVVLNIPYYKNNTLETHRINKAISCGCDVISLPSCDEDANNFYKDYIYLTLNIEESINDYLNRTDAVGTIQKKSYPELVKNLSKLINPHFLFCINTIHERFINMNKL